MLSHFPSIADQPPGSSCGVFTLMFIESLVTGNGFPSSAKPWSAEVVADRRAEYAAILASSSSASQRTYIPTSLFPLNEGTSPSSLLLDSSSLGHTIPLQAEVAQDSEFVDPPLEVCTPEALLSLPRISFEFQPGKWCAGKIDNIRSDRVRFRIKWEPTDDQPQATYSIEQLLPLSDPTAMKFKIPATEVVTAYAAAHADEERGTEAVRRSVLFYAFLLLTPSRLSSTSVARSSRNTRGTRTWLLLWAVHSKSTELGSLRTWKPSVALKQ